MRRKTLLAMSGAALLRVTAIQAGTAPAAESVAAPGAAR
jgi:hypothetical protein